MQFRREFTMKTEYYLAKAESVPLILSGTKFEAVLARFWSNWSKKKSAAK